MRMFVLACLFSIAASFILEVQKPKYGLPVPVPDITTYACKWYGRAPFCLGECPTEQPMELEQVGSCDETKYPCDKKSFGKNCWVGSKVYCCHTASTLIKNSFGSMFGDNN